MTLETTPAQIAHFELEIEIQASRERVWTSLGGEIGAWWLPDFHMLGPESVVTFDLVAGGQLLEKRPDGGSLLWSTVQWVTPGEVLYMVGHSHADWGGPCVDYVKIHLEEKEGGTVLRLRQDLVGNVTEQQARSLSEGWTRLFGQALKNHAEK